MNIAFAIAAAALAAGLICGLLAVWQPRPTLAVRLARLQPAEPATELTQPDTPPAGWSARLGAPAVPALQQLGWPPAQLHADLAILGRPVRDHLARQAATATLTAAASALAGVLLAGWAWLLPAACAGAAAGLALPVLAVRSQAAAARRDFRHALSAFLDLAAITLAAGGGAETALREAADGGQGPAFGQIRGALAAAQATGTTPWPHLDRLGQRLGIPELRELAASMELAGGQGARIRGSLATKATSLRTHLLGEAETQAAQASERMSLPVAILFIGFVIFIGYPAIVAIMAGL